jgi:hypothetical protein
MKETVTKYRFWSAFKAMGRENTFSWHGLNALFGYLEEYEESTGIEIELDVIGLCCEFSEYDGLDDFRFDYGSEYETMDDIERDTVVIPIDSRRFIIQTF